MKTVLFVSGSIGLGHITRDVAIVDELRLLCPGVRVVWFASEACLQVLRETNEVVAEESEMVFDSNLFPEAAAEQFGLKLLNPAVALRSFKRLKALLRHMRGQKENVKLLRKVMQNHQFDLIVADEASDLVFSCDRTKSGPKLVTICDRVGFDATSGSWIERMVVQIAGWREARLLKRYPQLVDLALMVGQREDIPDRRFGVFLPNRREIAKTVLNCVGYIVGFDPANYSDKKKLRSRLGYGSEPLVVCSIGGTAVGKALLELCGESYLLLRKTLPDLRMVLVCGPRLSPKDLCVPADIETRGYVHRLYEHFAASDLVITQGGGTSTIELTALRCPFVYFPLEGHCEQRQHVTKRLERQGSGVRLEYRQTTPEILVDTVLQHMGHSVDYPPIACNGARNAAQLLTNTMTNNTGAVTSPHSS